MVEYNLAKVKVEGSNPFLRKISFKESSLMAKRRSPKPKI